MRERSFFEALYAGSPDPWGFDSRWAEERKRALTIAALPRRRYARALEPGCSTGALTLLLADRVDELHSFDFIEDAVVQARQRTAGLANVHISDAQFPDFWPPGGGDLVVWSEVAYYLTTAELEIATQGVVRWLRPSGHLLTVHYRGRTDNPITGDAVGMHLDGVTALRKLVDHEEERFHLALWERSA